MELILEPEDAIQMLYERIGWVDFLIDHLLKMSFALFLPEKVEEGDDRFLHVLTMIWMLDSDRRGLEKALEQVRLSCTVQEEAA